MSDWDDILHVMYNELGESTGDVFREFYNNFPIEEQYKGAMEVLTKIAGPEKAEDLMKGIKKG